MDELKKLYQARDILTKTKDGVSADVQQRIEAREREVVKKALGVLEESATKMLGGLEKPLTINIVGDGLGGFTVSLALTEPHEFTPNPAPSAEQPVIPAPPRRTRSIPNRGLIVRFPDGTVYNEHTAAETMRRAVMKIGPSRIPPLGLKQCATPQVANFRSPNEKYARAQKPLGDGLYLMTCSDTPTKKQQLDTIARKLGIELEVTVV